MECIFCKIIAGKIPSAKVYEDHSIISFLDIAPANKGHILVLPKKHYETLTDTPETEVAGLFAAVKKIERALSSALGNDGYNILINNKKAAGQLVPHIHIHIIPRFADDGIRLNWKPQKYKDDEITKLAEWIKKFL